MRTPMIAKIDLFGWTKRAMDKFITRVYFGHDSEIPSGVDRELCQKILQFTHSKAHLIAFLISKKLYQNVENLFKTLSEMTGDVKIIGYDEYFHRLCIEYPDSAVDCLENIPPSCISQLDRGFLALKNKYPLDSYIRDRVNEPMDHKNLTVCLQHGWDYLGYKQWMLYYKVTDKKLINAAILGKCNHTLSKILPCLQNYKFDEYVKHQTSNDEWWRDTLPVTALPLETPKRIWTAAVLYIGTKLPPDLFREIVERFLYQKCP